MCQKCPSGSMSLIIKESDEDARWVMEESVHVMAEKRSFNQGFRGLPRGDDAGAETLMINRNHFGRGENGSILLKARKSKSYLRTQKCLIFPGFVRETKLKREGSMQDTVYYLVGYGLDLYDNGGHQKVLIGGDMFLDMCLLWLPSRGWIREDVSGGRGLPRNLGTN